MSYTDPFQSMPKPLLVYFINVSFIEPLTELQVQKAIESLFLWQGTRFRFYFCWNLQGRTVSYTKILQIKSKQKTIPQEIKDASIIHSYKRKGNRESTNNNRGNSPLVIAGKILSKHPIWPWNCQQKRKEEKENLYKKFVNLTRAFHTVSREGLR